MTSLLCMLREATIKIKKNPTSSLMGNALKGVTPRWDIFPCLLFQHFEKEHPHISTPEPATLLDAAANFLHGAEVVFPPTSL